MTAGLKRLFSFRIMFLAAIVMAFAAPSYAQQKKAEPTKEQMMSGIYAEHLATSVCKSEYGTKFKTSRLSVTEKRQLDAHLGGACKCLYTEAAQKSSPEMVLDYVMYMYGAQKDPTKPAQDQIAYIKSPGFRTVGSVYGDAAVRKKCGFIN